MTQTIISSNTFEDFIEYELTRALERFDQEEAAVYIYCHQARPYEPSRRVLVVTEADSATITVCIETAYELFAGDIHHCVRRIGTINRAEVTEKLLPLVYEAYEIVLAWKPTFANIEASAYLPN